MRIVGKVKNKLNQKWKEAKFALNLPYHIAASTQRPTILMYHGVCNIPNPYNKRHCYLNDFERQIAYLKKNSQVLSLKDFFEQKFHPNKTNIAITFDDGYLNNYSLALPILEKYQVPASMYITGLANDASPFIWADFLQIVAAHLQRNFRLEGEEFCVKNQQIIRVSDGKQLLHIIKHEKPEYHYKQALYAELHSEFETVKEKTSQLWKLMNDEQIRHVSQSTYISIGSHGLLHNNLGNINIEHAKKEITASKSYLENLTQKEVTEIAFPDGSYSAEVMHFCQANGIRYQLAAEHFAQESDSELAHLRKRNGIYQIGSWSNQLIFNE